VTLVRATALDFAGRIIDPDRLAVFRCTERSGDTLSGLTLESGTDQDFSIGDTIAAFVTSQALEDIHDSVSDLETAIRDVTDYGAIGDGATDDTAAIQAAIDGLNRGVTGYMQPNGGTIYFPPGTYRCASGLTITRKCTTFAGAGVESSILKYSGSGDFITIGSDPGIGGYDDYSGTANDWGFRDLSLYGPGPSMDATLGMPTPSTTRAVVDWKNGSGSMRNVRVTNFGTGFWGLNSDINTFDHCKFSHCNKGLHLVNRSDQANFFNCYWLLNNYGVFVEFASTGILHGGTFNSNIFGDLYFWSPSSANSTLGISPRLDCDWKVFGSWFESETSYPTVAAHVIFGFDGTSARVLKGLKMFAPKLLTNNSTRFLEQYAGTGLLIDSPEGRGANLIRFLSTNSISGVFATAEIRDPAMVSTGVTLVGGNTFGAIRVVDTGKRGNSGMSVSGNGDANAGPTGPFVQLEAVPDTTGRGMRMRWGSSSTRFTLDRNEGTVSAPDWQAFVGFDRSLGQGKTTYHATASPSSGTYVQGDRVVNTAPTALGTPGSQYVILGWACTVAGTPGTWVPLRSPIE
jgi:hypothetical protein